MPHETQLGGEVSESFLGAIELDRRRSKNLHLLWNKSTNNMAPLRKLAVLPLAAGFSPSLDPIRVSDRSGEMSFFRSTDPFFDDFGMLSLRSGRLFDRVMRAEQDDDFLADTPFRVRPAPCLLYTSPSPRDS